MKFLFTGLILLFSASALYAQDYTIVNNEVVLAKPITFKPGTAELSPGSVAGLKAIKKYLDEKSYISLLRIECHSDNTGNEGDNRQMTEKRAFVICQELINMGVDCKRLLPVGFGAGKPVADNNTPEGRASNRRVTLVNAALRGKLIGGMPADGGGQMVADPCAK